jgi:hypothetical protein
MNFWKDHGTKILGSITTVLGAITVAAPDQLASIFGSRAPAAVVLATGLLTIVRGFTNAPVNGGSE